MLLPARRRHQTLLYLRNLVAQRACTCSLLMNPGARLLRRAAAPLLAFGFLGLVAPGHAADICPWMNVATAAGYLGAPAAVTVNEEGDGTGTCVFEPLSGNAAGGLTISVTRVHDGEKELASYEQHCGSSAMQLKAIGNEAVLCADTTTASLAEQVIGRVRNSIFVISIGASTAPSNSADSSRLTEKVRAIAEQVAGNLF